MPHPPDELAPSPAGDRAQEEALGHPGEIAGPLGNAPSVLLHTEPSTELGIGGAVGPRLAPRGADPGAQPVVHHRVRDPSDRAARQVQADEEVGVLAAGGRKRLVEAAELHEPGPHDPAAGADRDRPAPEGDREAVGRRRRSHPSDPLRVDPSGLEVAADPVVVPEPSDHGSDPAPICDVVRVAEQEELPVSVAGPDVAGVGRSPALRTVDEPHRLPRCLPVPHEVGGAVGRAVVGHDHLERPLERLLGEGVELRGEGRLGVVGRDDDADLNGWLHRGIVWLARTDLVLGLSSVQEPTAPEQSGPLLLVASAGGHLTQLLWLRSRLRPGGDRPVTWVTSRGPQVEALPDEDDLVLARSVPPRDLLGVLRSIPLAIRTCRRVRPAAVVSTGSAIALAFLPVAALLGIPAVYIESATWDTGPSLTARILRFVPGIRLRTQSPLWADDRWRHVGSVLDGFDPGPTSSSTQIRSVVVTLGTMSDYPFRRLVQRLVDVLPDHVQVLWQTGCTDVADLGIEGRRSVPAAEMRHAITTADVVVAHAGTGTALTCLELGRCPLLVPREHRFGEHVDDHQSQTADRLAGRGLAVVRTVEDLAMDALEEAAGRSVIVRGDAPPIDLLDR